MLPNRTSVTGRNDARIVEGLSRADPSQFRDGLQPDRPSGCCLGALSEAPEAVTVNG